MKQWHRHLDQALAAAETLQGFRDLVEARPLAGWHQDDAGGVEDLLDEAVDTARTALSAFGRVLSGECLADDGEFDLCERVTIGRARRDRAAADVRAHGGKR